MNTSKKRKLSERILAFFMSFLMVLSMIPMNSIIVKAAPEDEGTGETVTIAFHVQNKDTNAIESATVTIGDVNSTTNASGNANLTVTKAEGYSYSVTKTGYVEVNGSLGADETTAEVTMTALVTITGIVKSGDDMIAEADVTVADYPQHTTKTSADGTFSIVDVDPSGTYTATITKEGYKDKTVVLSLTENNEIELEKKAEQSLSFAKSWSTMTCGASDNAIAKTSDGVVADSYFSSAPTIASVDEAGMVTAHAVGEVTITATLSATEEHAASEASFTFTVEPGTMRGIEWKFDAPVNHSWKGGTIDCSVKDAEDADPTHGISTGIISYSVVETDIATVDEAGMVTFSKPGTVTVTAIKYGDENYQNADNKSQYPEYGAVVLIRQITAVKAQQDPLTFDDPNPAGLTMADSGYQNQAHLPAANFNEDATIVYSSDKSFVTVDSEGRLTINGGGDVTITATLAGNDLYEESKASYTVSIAKKDQEGEFYFEGATEEGFTTTYSPDVFQLTVVCEDSGENIEFLIENATGFETAEIATVTPDESNKKIARLTLERAGVIYVKAVWHGGDVYNTKEIKCKVTINKAAQSVTFEKSEIPSISYGTTFTNKASALKNREVTYKVEKINETDPDIATVDEEGTVTAIGVGTVRIVAETAEDDSYEAASNSYELEIVKAEHTIGFEKGDAPVVVFNFDEGNGRNVFTNTAQLLVEADAAELVAEGKKPVYAVYDDADTEGVDGDSLELIEMSEEGNRIIDADTGKFTITGAGLVTLSNEALPAITIVVTYPETEHYCETTAQYVLTIKKANQNMWFEDKDNQKITEDITVYAGEQSKFNDAYPKIRMENEELVSGKALKYSYTALIDETPVEGYVESFNEDDGTIVLANIRNVGSNVITITVSAIKPGDENYEAGGASYTIKIMQRDYIGDGTKHFAISGDKGNVEKLGSFDFQWYVSSVAIAPLVDEDDQPLYYLYRDGDTTHYYTKENPMIFEDGKYGYSTNKKDGILIQESAPYEGATIGNADPDRNWRLKIGVDTKKPFISGISVKEITLKEGRNWWDRLWTFVTFHNKTYTKLIFTVDAEDATSGVAGYQFYVDENGDPSNLLSNDELNAITEWNDGGNAYGLTEYQYQYDKKASTDRKFVLYVKVTDKAGNVQYSSTKGVIYDSTMPNAVLTVKTEKSEKNVFYTSDVRIGVKVNEHRLLEDGTVDENDDSVYSGIKKISYKVILDNNYDAPTQEGTLYEYSAEDPQYDDLLSEWISDEDTDIIVLAGMNNSDDVQVILTVEDNAENVNTYTQKLSICMTSPTIEISFIDDDKGLDAEKIVDTYQGIDYLVTEKRTAKIVIANRESAFDEGGVSIGVNQSKGDPEDTVAGYNMSGWTKAGSGDDATYTKYIYFTGNHLYDFSVSYKDLADHEALTVSSSQFAIDRNDDNVSCTISIRGNTWSRLLNTLTFHIWSNASTDVRAEFSSLVSPIKAIDYYVSESEIALDEDALKEIPEMSEENPDGWQPFERYGKVTIDPDKLFVFYIRVKDYAGHTQYFSSDGVILETKPSEIELEYAAPNENGFYKNNLNVDVTVTDPEIFSGIKTIEYWVVKDNDYANPTQSAVLYDFASDFTSTLEDSENIPYNKLQSQSSITKSFVINAANNDSDNVKLFVKVVDNAGNVSYYGDAEDDGEGCSGLQYVPLSFSNTKPSIDVVFEEKTKPGRAGDSYFTERSATITVTNRTSAFDAKTLLEGKTVVDEEGNEKHYGLVITGTDALGQPVEINMNELVTPLGDTLATNPNADQHKFRVDFLPNANYDFSLSYIDKAGNVCEYGNVTFNGKARTSTDQFFTVDNVDPWATVSIGDYTWTKLLSTLTFGLWGHEKVLISATANDVTSPYKIQYYKTNKVTAMSKAGLDKVAEADWTTYAPFTVDQDERFVVYLKVTDYAGNYIYLNTDGYIVDKRAPQGDNLTGDEYCKITLDETSIYTDETKTIGIYNRDVNAKIDIKEMNTNYSGLKYVDYWVTKNGEFGDVTQEKKRIFDFQYTRDKGVDANGGVLNILEDGKDLIHEEANTPVHATLVRELHKEVTVFADKNNNSDVWLHVEVCDNADNKRTITARMDIDITAPTISITYNNNDVFTVVSGVGEERGYFPNDRKATIVITERRNHFDTGVAQKGITLTAYDSQKKPVEFDLAEMTNSWSWSHDYNDANPDLDKHTLTINYTTDANYTFGISYTDKASNQNNGVNTNGSTTPYLFTVDKVAPTGTITVKGSGELNKTWEKLLESLTFGIWRNDAVAFSGISEDSTSPETFVTYWKTPDTTVKTVSQLQEVTDWNSFNGFTVTPNEQLTVYLKIMDLSGNTTYICSDGVILDDSAPTVENIAPEIVIEANGGNGIYRKDVGVSVNVFDPIVGGTYSGLKTVEYTVSNMGSVTQSGTLYSFDVLSPAQNELRQNWNGSLTVNSSSNNSNDVAITVYAVDNSGNRSSKSIKIMIDVSEPEISVNYDNNDGDATFRDETTDAFFKADRTATIAIRERNFDPGMVSITITNTDGPTPTLSGWTNSTAGGNGDGNLHTATLTYSADGDYTFDVSCTDLAGNQSKDVNYGNNLAPKKFTIDKTLPVINVVYDNNDAQNGNYYKAKRTATVTITEHNFEQSRIKATLRAEDDGNTITAPKLSNWTTQGDVHTATIAYDTDALYTFDLDYDDKAGNKAANLEEQKFYVDLTMPMVKIENIQDQSANSGDGNIGFKITATDTNFDVFEPVITAKVMGEKGVYTKRIDIAESAYTDVRNGQVVEINNLEADGIYNVTCTVVDKAGNEFDQVILTKDDGTEYTVGRSGEQSLISFSVNRNGSAYSVPETTESLIEKYYVQRVDEDIVLIETNTDPLKSYVLTLNGRQLEEGVDYKVEPDENNGNGNWYTYRYIIFKSLFNEEGTYTLESSSVDMADNQTFNDLKNTVVEFVVDRTAPVVTVSGLEPSGRYQTESQTVTLIPTDDGGKLKSLVVELVNANGDKIKDLVNLQGDVLTEELEKNDNKITFNLGEGLYQNVRIVCDDYADPGNDNNVYYDDIVRNVSVANSAVLIYWANKPLRYGSMGGVAAVIGLVVFLIVRKKRRRF